MSVPKDFAANIVGGFVLLLAAGVVAGLFVIELPPGNRDVAFTVLGIAIGWAGSVVQYHFGTSSGSKRKTDLMNERPPRP